MNLMEQWRSVAYNEATGKEKLQQLWAAYFQEEKEIYAQLLKNPDEVVKGTVKEPADKYQVSHDRIPAWHQRQPGRAEPH